MGQPYQGTMFVLSKVFNFFLNPGVWVPVILAIGVFLLWTRWRSAGRKIVTGMALFLLLVSVLPMGQITLAPLENRFPLVREIDGPVEGIVVLGGAIRSHLSSDRGQPSLTDAAERMTEFVKLARRHPEARLVFTGGSGNVLHRNLKETDTARQLFDELGIESGRVLYESDSRNTLENARFTYWLVMPEKGQRWVLVTSASHMPRAVGVFRAEGWDPLPYPVDFNTVRNFETTFTFNLTGGLKGLGAGLYEWAGLLIYRILGRSEELFPGPLPETRQNVTKSAE